MASSLGTSPVHLFTTSTTTFHSALQMAYARGLQNLNPPSTFTLSHQQAGCLNLLSQCLAKLKMEELWRNPRESRDQCEFRLHDSCSYHILLWTCFTSAATQLVSQGGPRAGIRNGYTFGSIFPSYSEDAPSELTDYLLSKTFRLAILSMHEAGLLRKRPTATLNLEEDSQSKAGPRSLRKRKTLNYRSLCTLKEQTVQILN